jgi:Domain of unknown function (DUF4360)
MAPKPLIIISIFMGLNMIFGAIALAQSVPDGAAITDVRLVGSGCDMASASVVLSPDLKDMSLFFDNYVVEIGEGSEHPTLLKLQKDCQIQVQMQIPDGWQMAFKGADYRGFVALSSQGTAFHRFSILQEGAPIVSMREASLNGPVNTDYHARSEVRPERVTWSKCLSGLTSVNLMSQIGVSLNPRSSDRSLTQIVLDSTDTSFKQSLSVDWRRCTVSRPDPRPRPPGPIRPEPRPRPDPRPRPSEPVRPPRFVSR